MHKVGLNIHRLKKPIPTASILILLFFGWGLFFYQYFESKNEHELNNSNEYHGLQYYKVAPNFALTDHNGEKVRLSSFRGKVVIISWGYSNCPDICPLTLSMLRKVMGELGDKSEKVQVLFITTDPERDTPQRLKSYVPYFHKSFIGLTGSQKDIKEVVKDYNAFFIRHSDVYGRGQFDTWDSYQMTHTTTISLIDEKGKLILYYPYDKWSHKGLAGDIIKILSG